MSILTAAIVFQCTQLGVTVKLHGLEGWIASLQEQPDRYRRVGGRGRGVQSTGQLGRPDSHPVWCAYATKAEAMAAAGALESLQSRVCRVTDQHGRILERVLVGAVAVTTNRRCRGPVIKTNTQATYRIEATMELELLPVD